MSSLLVTGYASLDYSINLAGTVLPDQTTHISHRDTNSWPRTGGSPFYVGSAVARLGMQANLLAWIGEDNLAQKFLNDCSHNGVDTVGVAQLAEERSPICLMIHQNDGSTSCLFDPAFSGKETLGDDQKKLIKSSKNICVTVGPSHLLGEILSLIPNTANLYWVTKKDAAAFPTDVCQQLAQRSQVIFCNRSERPWLTSMGATAPIIVETHGADGVKVFMSGKEQSVSAVPIETTDPTGAGDTFAGGFIENFSRTGNAIEAAEGGIECARQLLETRKIER